ncbi:sulfatase-like hydrolase/transferase [Lewinella sp. W8]|uniref:sulfatase-like hydrolase/transferase n=1 Tax=Lewinella sp. W8 TaxID=2528208 RepID=UPI0010686A4C|nr:sulfatase-like hydrolase/transferase [Lewinella sp. W8]MTB52789.1 sulfatase-like hydrolase/transferase [Lewinella sp. W8]
MHPPGGNQFHFPFSGILLLLLAMTSCGDAPDAPPDTPPRPNILFLFTDDQTYHSLAALGNKEIHTPNLDRLVGRGTTFTHTFNMGGWNGAICLASRAMINSGRAVWGARAHSESWRAGDSLALEQSWGRLMQGAGYATYFTGKWHVSAPPQAVFETVGTVRGGMPPDGYPFGDITALFQRHDGDPPRDSLVALLPPGYNRPLSPDDRSWSPTDSLRGGFWQGGKHWSEVVADEGIEYLRDAADDDRPFFLYLAFNAPHDPRQAPREFVDRYPVTAVDVPANFLPDYPYAREVGNGPGLRDEDLAPFPRTELSVRTHRAEYYALITHLDAQLGRVLAALEATGQADNTLIMFTADHGLAVGQHGFIGKQNLYDHSVRVPLVLAGPGVPAGKRVDAPVYLQDVMPTALELADVPVPDYVFFHSLLPLMEGAPSPYPAIYGAYRHVQRMIREDGHKLLVYPGVPTLRLYDLVADPLETEDLAGKPAHRERIQSMLRSLRAQQQLMGDTLSLAEAEQWIPDPMR